jgi:hypothetical protein
VLVQFLVWYESACSFDVLHTILLKISTKQLKLRDPSGNPTPMPKLAYEEKNLFNA